MACHVIWETRAEGGLSPGKGGSMSKDRKRKDSTRCVNTCIWGCLKFDLQKEIGGM